MQRLAPEQTPRPTYDGPWIPAQDFLDDLPRLMRIVSLPGLTMAAVEDGELAWTHAAGVTNVETGEPMHDDSMFEAASMTKPLFAYAVMKMAEEGSIDLDRPLVNYYRPEDLSDHPDNEIVTPRHVLTHTTGYPNWRSESEEKLTPLFKPGSGFSYSGEAFQWLQYAVEAITGAGVDSAVRSRLFEPAAMFLSTFGWDDETARRLVYGHQETDDTKGRGKLGPQYSRINGDRLLPLATGRGKMIAGMTDAEIREAVPEAKGITNVAGNLRTTASEYARFMTLMMERPNRAPWEVSEAGRRAMLTCGTVRKADALYIGLGWMLEPTPTGIVFSHSGNNANMFKTFGVGDPARRRAFVVFTNGGGGGDLFPRIVRAATGRDLLELM